MCVAVQFGPSGGTTVLIRKSVADCFCIIPVVYDNVSALSVCRKLLGTDKDLIVLCAYLPPMGVRQLKLRTLIGQLKLMKY